MDTDVKDCILTIIKKEISVSLYKGTQLVAGGRQTMPLLSFMWADHQLNDISWLRADTFSWQSGAVYTAVYQHLVDDYNNIPTEATVYVYHSSSPVGYFYRDSYFDVNGASHPYAYARYNSDGSIKVLAKASVLIQSVETGAQFGFSF